MRCNICDEQDDNISIDPRDGKFRPCFVCQGVIMDALISEPEVNGEIVLIDEGFDNGC